ncbi:hypothetical protein [Staphylococcus aureus]|nr:hypothetical protein [Staphylococcus aureus]HDA8627610.1 hypothetical protein [Staphylococcus aureus]HDB2913572.1 hypothetical protein [Staphylococcus aureus]
MPIINVGDLWDNEHKVYNHWGGLDINDYRSTY